MTSFFALLRLQLLSRYADLKPRNLKREFMEHRGRSVWKTIGVIVLVLYLAGFLFGRHHIELVACSWCTVQT